MRTSPWPMPPRGQRQHKRKELCLAFLLVMAALVWTGVDATARHGAAFMAPQQEEKHRRQKHFSASSEHSFISQRSQSVGMSMINDGKRRSQVLRTDRNSGASPGASSAGGAANGDMLVGIDADRMASRMQATATNAMEHDLLMDNRGKINRDLAERLWQWEQARRKSGDRKFPYSVRRGLRLVQDIIFQFHALDTDDLVQDGVIALMQAMSTYKESNETTTIVQESDKDRFEQYARAYITRQLQLSVESSKLLKPQADSEHGAQSKSSSSTSPSNSERSKSSPRLISVEDTISVMDPESPKYRNLNQWEKSHDVILNDGARVDAEEYLDQSVALEGDDLMWVRQHQIAEPLKDSINDDENGNNADNEDSLINWIRNDVDGFLSPLDDETQANVIRLRFGFGDASPRSPRQVALVLGLELSQVLILQERALGKLRQAYADRYVQVLGEYDEDYYQEDYVWEDSV